MTREEILSEIELKEIKISGLRETINYFIQSGSENKMMIEQTNKMRDRVRELKMEVIKLKWKL